MTSAAAASAQPCAAVVPKTPPHRRCAPLPRRAGRPAVIRDRTAEARFGVGGQPSSAPRAVSCCSSSATGGLLELCPQARQCPRQTGIGGAFGAAERRGGFITAELEKVPAR